MNLQRRHHFVAECLQEGFTDESGRVWVKFANKPEPELRNPHSVGMQRSLYIQQVAGRETDNVERFFGTLETPFAKLVQRVKIEREEFNDITTPEAIAIFLYVATQTVRTLAHKGCIEAQAGRPVDNKTFIRTMLRQAHTIAEFWLKDPPKLRFFTTLPYIGEHFIGGDHPVTVIHVHDNLVWTPTDEPKSQITQLPELLKNPKYGFWLPLSPYVCVSVQANDGIGSYLPPEPMEPPMVRMLNGLLRGHCRRFIFARDKTSLN